MHLCHARWYLSGAGKCTLNVTAVFIVIYRVCLIICLDVKNIRKLDSCWIVIYPFFLQFADLLPGRSQSYGLQQHSQILSLSLCVSF